MWQWGWATCFFHDTHPSTWNEAILLNGEQYLLMHRDPGNQQQTNILVKLSWKPSENTRRQACYNFTATTLRFQSKFLCWVLRDHPMLFVCPSILFNSSGTLFFTPPLPHREPWPNFWRQEMKNGKWCRPSTENTTTGRKVGVTPPLFKMFMP
jgi:hypothetical protein